MSNFECRFTGEETKKFCDGFTYLILANIDEDIEKPSNVFLYLFTKWVFTLGTAYPLLV
jgi:hypothetical protein